MSCAQALFQVSNQKANLENPLIFLGNENQSYKNAHVLGVIRAELLWEMEM